MASRCKVHGETYNLYNRSIGVLGSSILHEATKFNGDVMEQKTCGSQKAVGKTVGVQVPPSLPNFEKAVDIRRRCGKMKE